MRAIISLYDFIVTKLDAHFISKIVMIVFVTADLMESMWQ